MTLDTSQFLEHPLLFCNFLKSDDRLYQQLSDWRQCCPIFLDYQMRYNLNGHSTLKMVFFKEAVEHVLRICRVLQQPGGHLLLIGLDGTGRRTCLELGAFISGHTMFQLNLKRGYSHQEFRDDMKIVSRHCATNADSRIFLLGLQNGHRTESPSGSVHSRERSACRKYFRWRIPISILPLPCFSRIALSKTSRVFSIRELSLICSNPMNSMH